MLDAFRLFRRVRDIEIESDASATVNDARFGDVADELKAIQAKLTLMDKELVVCGQCRLVLHVSGVAATGTRAVNGSGEEPVQFCRWCAQTLKSRGLLDKQRGKR